MQIIPSIDLEHGRSRLVFWPGVSVGAGAPTDRPERIARHFVELGAPAIHVVDLDGARAGRPMNLEAIGAIAAGAATPLQVAGGIDGPDQIRLVFAAGATRVVMPLHAVAEAPATLRASLDVAGSWLAVGLDPRPERLREYPWKSPVPPTLDERSSIGWLRPESSDSCFRTAARRRTWACWRGSPVAERSRCSSRVASPAVAAAGASRRRGQRADPGAAAPLRPDRLRRRHGRGAVARRHPGHANGPVDGRAVRLYERRGIRALRSHVAPRAEAT